MPQTFWGGKYSRRCVLLGKLAPFIHLCRLLYHLSQLPSCQLVPGETLTQHVVIPHGDECPQLPFLSLQVK